MDKHGATSLLLTISLWWKVAASPAILGLLVALGLWFGLDSTLGKISAIVVGCLGLALGIYFAERLRRRNGLLEFLTSETRSPEFGVDQKAPEGPRR